jgi:hypothetical protein
MSYADNPRHPANPSAKTESTGPIASDSLAAESLRSGGDFAANDPSNPEPMGVPGSKSTLATTDTSGAVPLHPASSGSARERQDEQGLGSDERGTTGVRYPEGLGGQPDFPGTHTGPDGGYYGGPSSGRTTEGFTTGATGASDFGSSILQDSSSGGGAISSSSGGAGATSSSGDTGGPTSGTGVRPYVPEGPTYTGRVAGTLQSEGESQPKGENLTEGDIPATKTFVGDVGGPHDPGRLAEREFEKINAEAPGGGVGSGRSYGGGEGEDKGGFEVLESERA